MNSLSSYFLAFIKAYSKTIIVFYLWLIVGFIQPNLNFISSNRLFFTQSTKLRTILVMLIGTLIYQLLILSLVLSLYSLKYLLNSLSGLTINFFCFLFVVIITAIVIIMIYSAVYNHPSFIDDYYLNSPRDFGEINIPIVSFLFVVLDNLNIFSLNFPSRLTSWFSGISFMFASFDYWNFNK